METRRTKGLTFGCWDLLHAGHVRFLQNARSFCGYLIVGIPTDEVIEQDKGVAPVISLDNRVTVLSALSCVNEVRVYRNLEFLEALKHAQPDILFIGEQWGNSQRHIDAENWMKSRRKEVRQFPYTQGISTSSIIQKIKDQ